MHKIFAYIIYIYFQNKRGFWFLRICFIVKLHNRKHLDHLRNLVNSDVQLNQIIMKILS